ncbi:MAG: tyrosine-type recombinase/integrase [Mariprofundales bacterium]
MRHYILPHMAVFLAVFFILPLPNTANVVKSGTHIMALTDIKIRKLKLPPDKKEIKVTDGGGMRLVIKASGKYWRLDYRINGKRKTLAIGIYPETNLKEARAKRDTARTLIAQGIDPMIERATRKICGNAESFAEVAREWHSKREHALSKKHAGMIISRLEKNIFPWLGNKQIGEIEPAEMLATLRRIEARGTIELTHRLKSICGQVFRYAVATGKAKRDPTLDLRGALSPTNPRHRSAITTPKEAGGLMRSIQEFKGSFVVFCALRISAYAFVRQGELRHAEWSDIDLENAQWRIPANKMKMKTEHLVPLSDQVIRILHELQALTGNGTYVFPSCRTPLRPMSENTVNTALRRLGYSKEEMCAHGFRGMASTLLHELGWSSDLIEIQLAHCERNSVKAAYNHAQHIPERTKMMQSWADHLDNLQDGANVVAFRRCAANP